MYFEGEKKNQRKHDFAIYVAWWIIIPCDGHFQNNEKRHPHGDENSNSPCWVGTWALGFYNI